MTEEQIMNMTDDELNSYILQSKEEESNDGLLQEEKEEISFEEQNEVEESEELSSIDDDSAEDKNETKTETETETKQEEVTTNIYSIKANGKEYNLSIDELIKLAPKAMDYVKKTTAIKPYRTMISAMEDNGVSKEDINLLIDIKKGNKEALSKLVKDVNVDLYDIPDNSEEYIPTDYGKTQKAIDFEDSLSRINTEPEFARTVAAFKELDDYSKNFLYENPQSLEGFHNDIKSGMYDKIITDVEKTAAMDEYKKPMLEYYIQVGQEYLKNLESTPVQKNTDTIDTKALNDKKARVSLPKQRVDNSKNYLKDLDDDDDEEFNAWYKSLQRKI
ncbi:hypothetical protein [Campylobacter fetus]|uniref:hypothetical protein n=1 Tax=Campylobacter fetus TaxID=196 RepID=UPI000FC9BC5B|nr:hypothetical protein [Campylobacter fetus]RUT50994.1 hypothetical protein BWK67_00275 [Campylobacter fetus]RUT51722.1 hypothetical protein BWK51_00275 [Campylobacter fetus]